MTSNQFIPSPATVSVPGCDRGRTASNSPLLTFPAVISLNKLLRPSKLGLDIFIFLLFLVFFILWHRLFVIETLVPAMFLCSLCLHSVICRPLCVADSSHALVRIRLLRVGERSEAVDNRDRMCPRGPVTALTA